MGISKIWTIRKPGYHHFHSTNYNTKFYSFFPLCFLRPRTTSIIPPTFNFYLGILLTSKCVRVPTNKLGAYGIARTSLHRY
ncbi:hypothetical protein Hanom_Chr10g00903741 [Helianthus anomalus]